MKVVYWLDSPRVLDCSVHPIPAVSSSPYQVIASTPRHGYSVRCAGSVSQIIGLYVGPVGSEVLHCQVRSNEPEKKISIPRSSRISIKNEDTSAITSGWVSFEFFGAKEIENTYFE